jgi:hypothetical protein
MKKGPYQSKLEVKSNDESGQGVYCMRPRQMSYRHRRFYYLAIRFHYGNLGFAEAQYSINFPARIVPVEQQVPAQNLEKIPLRAPVAAHSIINFSLIIKYVIPCRHPLGENTGYYKQEI